MQVEEQRLFNKFAQSYIDIIPLILLLLSKTGSGKAEIKLTDQLVEFVKSSRRQTKKRGSVFQSVDYHCSIN